MMQIGRAALEQKKGVPLRGRNAPLSLLASGGGGQDRLRAAIVGAHKFVSLDVGYDARLFLFFFLFLVPLNASQAPDADRAGQRDFMGQSQHDLYR